MPRLTAEIIAIGDEMTSGARLDTNSQWLSTRLGELGIEVCFHTTVGDTLSHNVDAFRIATRRVDVVVATGGLGPTLDDLTREAIALSMGRPLVLHEASLRHIESLFAHRGTTMPERNREQAKFPLGAEPIANPRGTAPGIAAVIDREDSTCARLFALPGVPAEMKSMFNDSVVPALLDNLGGPSMIRHAVLKFFGVGESDMEQRLGGMIARDRHPRVGITVSDATISLRITAMAGSADECEAVIATTRSEIMQRVGELYFGEGESFEQQHAVAGTLSWRGETLLLVELGYAAPLGHWFAALGSNPSLAGGISLADRADLARLASTDDVSRDAWAGRTALDVLRARFQADWTLVVDAYPSLATLDSLSGPPSVTIQIIDPTGQTHDHISRVGGHPSILHARIAKTALAEFRKLLAATDTVTLDDSSIIQTP